MSSTRTLLLLRHGDTDAHWAGDDHARPLGEAGRRQAADVGRQLREADRRPDVVMSSTAQRCRETVEEVFAAAGWLPGAGGDGDEDRTVRVEFQDALYLAEPEVLAQRIGEIEDEATTLLVVAHSPGLPSLATELTYSSGHGEADAIRCAFPPAGLVRLHVPGPWSTIAEGTSTGITVVDESA